LKEKIDLDEVLKGKEILFELGMPSGSVRSAMILYNGAPIELIKSRNGFERVGTFNPEVHNLDVYQCSQRRSRAVFENSKIFSVVY